MYILVGLATRVHITVYNSRRDKRLFSPPKRPSRLWGSPELLFSGYHASCPGCLKLTAYHHVVKSKYVWSYTAAPLICIHGIKKQKYLPLPPCIVFTCFVSNCYQHLRNFLIFNGNPFKYSFPIFIRFLNRLMALTDRTKSVVCAR